MVQQPGGGGSIISGDPLVADLVGEATALGLIRPSDPGGPQGPMSEWDKMRQYFQLPLISRDDIRSLYTPNQSGPGAMFPMGAQPPPGIAAPGHRGPGQDFSHLASEDNRRIRQAADKENMRVTNDRKKLERLAKEAGLIGDEFLQSELESIWQAAIDEAEASSVMGEMVTPWEILEFWSKDPSRARRYAPAGPSAPDLNEIVDQSKVVTTRNTHVDLTDPETARAVIRSGLQGALGRDPSDEEEARFRSFLNELERSNPTVTEQTQEYDASGQLVSTESFSEGGAPSPMAAQENFIADEYSDEAFAYRMGTEGASVMQQLVSSLV